MMPAADHSVKFLPPQSSFDPSFWEELYQKKLNVYRINKLVTNIKASFIPKNNGIFSFNRLAFITTDTNSRRHIGPIGVLTNTNTIEV